KAKLVQSRIKMLERLPKLDELADIESLDFEFRHAPFTAKTLLEARDVSFGYAPDHLLFRGINLTINAHDKFGVIGNNGKGKSTLLNLIAGGLVPVTGDIKTHSDMRLGYFGQTNIQRLNPQLTIEEEIEQTNPTLTRTQVRNICGTMMFGGDLALKKVSVLSGGREKPHTLGQDSRSSFKSTVVGRTQQPSRHGIHRCVDREPARLSRRRLDRHPQRADPSCPGHQAHRLSSRQSGCLQLGLRRVFREDRLGRGKRRQRQRQ